jgi:hypothetical protein
VSETTIEHQSVEAPAGDAMPSAASDEQLLAMPVDRARSEALQLTGEGGLLQQLTKRVLESALEGEITDHLGYEKHDPAGKNNGNGHNGTRAKTGRRDHQLAPDPQASARPGSAPPRRRVRDPVAGRRRPPTAPGHPRHHRQPADAPALSRHRRTTRPALQDEHHTAANDMELRGPQGPPALAPPEAMTLRCPRGPPSGAVVCRFAPWTAFVIIPSAGMPARA